jgi:hypothetical protein
MQLLVLRKTLAPFLRDGGLVLLSMDLSHYKSPAEAAREDVRTLPVLARMDASSLRDLDIDTRAARRSFFRSSATSEACAAPSSTTRTRAPSGTGPTNLHELRDDALHEMMQSAFALFGPFRSEDDPEHVLAETRSQGNPLDDPECPLSVRLPLRPEEQDVLPLLVAEAVREFVEVRSRKRSSPTLQKSRRDLPRDFGSLALVRRRERFVEQHDRIGGETVHDRAHASKLFVEFSAFHRSVLLAAAVGEHGPARVRAEGRRRDEHAALHHELRLADASQERRLSP